VERYFHKSHRSNGKMTKLADRRLYLFILRWKPYIIEIGWMIINQEAIWKKVRQVMKILF